MAKHKYNHIKEHEAKEIKLLLDRGLTIGVVSETFGIHSNIIRTIKHLKSWKELKI